MKNPVCFRYAIFILFVVSGCGRGSSPEGRMSIKVEALQKELIDSLRQQNKAILDSLSAIRADVNELKQKVNK
jgi:hypothetical protein